MIFYHVIHLTDCNIIDTNIEQTIDKTNIKKYTNSNYMKVFKFTGKLISILLVILIIACLFAIYFIINSPEKGESFTEFYIREISGDFNVKAGSDAEYIMVPARTEFRAIAGAGQTGSPAIGSIYIGELNSGQVSLYGFMYRSAPRPSPPQELVKVATFPFRETFGN